MITTINEYKKYLKTIDEIISGDSSPLPISVIPNNMGINLVSVDSIEWTEQNDKQLVDLTINFKSTNTNEFKDKLPEYILMFFIKYGSDYYNNEASVLEFIQNNCEDYLSDENIELMLNALKDAMHKYENYDNLSTDITIINKETLEPIDTDEYEVDSIIDIITDVEEIKKFEGASTISSYNSVGKDIKKNSIIWLSCLLKPKGNNANAMSVMGCIQCRVMNTFQNLDKLKQLKKTDIIF